MLAFVARRLARLVVSLAVLLVLSFAMIHLIPGDPVRAALGPRAPQSLVDARRHDLWLDRPVPDQFTHYVSGIFSGDMGMSLVSNLPVSQVVSERLGNTAVLVALAFAAIMGLAVPVGMAAAILTRDGARRPVEAAFTTSTGFLAIVPEFVLGVALI